MSDQVYYLENGQEVYLINEVQGGYIVEECMEHEDQEPWTGEPKFVKKIWATPPTKKYEAKVAELQEQLKSLGDGVRATSKELLRLEDQKRRLEQVMAKDLRYPIIQSLFDYLSGEAKYFAYWLSGKGWVVEEVGKEQYRTIKLLELNVQRNTHHIKAAVNDYSDPFEVYFFKTLNDAEKFIKKRVVDDVIRSLEQSIQLGQSYSLGTAIERANNNEVAIPAKLAKKIQNFYYSRQVKAVENAEAALEREKNKLLELSNKNK